MYIEGNRRMDKSEELGKVAQVKSGRFKNGGWVILVRIASFSALRICAPSVGIIPLSRKERAHEAVCPQGRK